MLKFKLHLCFQVLICWSVLNVSNALVGNRIQQATNHEFPFIVSIGAKNVNGKAGHYHYCTGALISKQHVLSAEHCFYDSPLSEIQVSVGSADNQNGKRYDVALVKIFEDWAKDHEKPIKFSDNDVAIVRLSKPVDDLHAKPAVATFKKPHELYGKDAMTAGWGVSNTGRIPRYMEKAHLHVVDYMACMENVKRIAGQRIIIPENYLCTLSDADALLQSGDSGGPLFIGNEIIAVNEATFPEDRPDDDSNVQNIHTPLVYYKDFIEDMLHS